MVEEILNTAAEEQIFTAEEVEKAQKVLEALEQQKAQKMQECKAKVEEILAEYGYTLAVILGKKEVVSLVENFLTAEKTPETIALSPSLYITTVNETE